MATGGGKSSSYGSSGLSLPSGLLSTPSSSSHSDSLQTPDTSTLFVSSLSNIGSSASNTISAPAIPTIEPDFSGSTSPHSFTSLEELLNVTGINSPGLEGPGGMGGGVYSLQQLAKEVDSGGQQDSFDLQPPPKKLHLDPAVPLSQPHPQTQQQSQLPGNIRVQPLRSVSPLTEKPLAPFQNNRTTLNTTLSNSTSFQLPSSSQQLSSAPLSTFSSTPVVSTLYSSVPQSSVGLPPQPTTALPTLSSGLFGNVTQSTTTSLQSPHTTQARVPQPSLSNPSSTSMVQPQQASGLPSFQPSQILSSVNHSTMPPLPSLPFSTATASQSSSSVTIPPTNRTTLGGGALTVHPNPSQNNPLVQLIMLYKNCQALGDEQGMARVKQLMQQAAQAKLLTQASKSLTQTTQPTSSTSQVMSGVGSSVPFQPSVRTSGVSQSEQKTSSTESQLFRFPPRPAASHFATPSVPRASSSGPLLSSTQPPLNSASSWNSSTTATNPIPSSLEQGAQQRVIKQLQSLMATLPDTQRPKNVTELREFVQKFGSRINMGNNKVGAGSQTNKLTTPGTSDFSSSTSDTSSLVSDKARAMVTPAVPSLLKTEGSHSSLGAQLSSTVSTALPPSSSGLQRHPPASKVSSTPFGGSASAQVAEHFKTSLLGIQQPPRSTVSSVPPSILPTLQGASQLSSSIHFPSTSMPTVSAQDTTPIPANTGGVLGASPRDVAMASVATTQSGPLQSTPAMTVHAPVTAQFQQAQPGSSMQQLNKMPTAKVPSNPQGIQPGVPTPLPPGLTLETLGVLCRLPESELVKLKIPAALLSAIRVWKARQMPVNKTTTKQSTVSTTRNSNIPVLTAPSSDATSSTGSSSSIVTFRANGNIFAGQNVKVGDALKATSSLSNAAASSRGQQQQPMVIPSSAGFPPRSLHAYIPMIPQAQQLQRSTPSGSSGTRNVSQHMTRFQTKIQQQKSDSEKLQALTRALQSSEEARIAFRFSAHLEKMHSQLMSPDTLTPFQSHHDVLARLLPYHIYAEPEPPPAAVEKADAVFESVAQVLLSRSRGLMSRFQQMVTKTEAQGGPGITCMQLQLERLFQEGEQERIRQENVKKQQAEQVAADLSLMADGMDSFDADFSLGDAFFPMLEMDPGIT